MVSAKFFIIQSSHKSLELLPFSSSKRFTNKTPSFPNAKRNDMYTFHALVPCKKKEAPQTILTLKGYHG